MLLLTNCQAHKTGFCFGLHVFTHAMHRSVQWTLVSTWLACSAQTYCSGCGFICFSLTKMCVSLCVNISVFGCSGESFISSCSSVTGEIQLLQLHPLRPAFITMPTTVQASSVATTRKRQRSTTKRNNTSIWSSMRRKQF